MSPFFNFLKTFFYLAFVACIITLICFLSSCRSAKINSTRQKTTEQTSTSVEVKKQESVVATVSTTKTEETQKEGYNSWNIALSSDSDAVPFQFTLPDGSVIAGKAKGFSGTGKMMESRTASTQQQKTEQRATSSDSSAKQKVQKSEEVQVKTVERKTPTFWRPVAIGAVVILLLVGAFIYFKPKIRFL